MELVKEMKIQTYAVLFGSFRVASKIPKVFSLTNVKLALTTPPSPHTHPLISPPLNLVKQALRNSCELLRQRKELHASSWTFMQAHVSKIM